MHSFISFQIKTNFNCQKPTQPGAFKQNIGVVVTDSKSGKPSDLPLYITIIYPPEKSCPSSCTTEISPSGKLCICEDLLEFDLAKQIKSIFGSSEISTLTKVNSLLSWEFYQSPIFWTDVIACLWLGGTLYLFKKKPAVNNYCRVTLLRKNYEKNLLIEHRQHSWYCQFSFIISLENSSFSNIYFYQDPLIRKSMRAFLYFNRIILYGTFGALFANSSQSVNLYMIIINYTEYTRSIEKTPDWSNLASILYSVTA